MPMVEVSNGGTVKEYTVTTVSTPFNIVLDVGDFVCPKANASNAAVLINGVEASSGSATIDGLQCLSRSGPYGNNVWRCIKDGTYSITAIRYEVGSTLVHPVQ